MKIGFIGYRNHALRLMKLIDRLDFDKQFSIYYPNQEQLRSWFGRDKIQSQYSLTETFEDLQKTDVVFIASPTETHFEYLHALSESYQGYIFCEKPPCGSSEELDSLSRFADTIKTRVFFNFCYRYSAFAQTCKTIIGNGEFGTPVSLSFRSGHGLAFKECFKHNWRNVSANPLNDIVGNVGIHYVDLSDYLLGQSTNLSLHCARIAPNTRYQDSIHITLERKGGLPTSVFLSYACPLEDFAQLIFSDGIIELQKGDLTTRAPRECFDSDGWFEAPPTRRTLSFGDSRAYYDDAIVNSLIEFFGVATHSDQFPLVHFQSAINSTQKILNIRRDSIDN